MSDTETLAAATALATLVEQAFDDRSLLGAGTPHEAAVLEALAGLDAGVYRVASPPDDPRADDAEWTVHAWLKKAILLYFRVSPMARSMEPVMRSA